MDNYATELIQDKIMKLELEKKHKSDQVIDTGVNLDYKNIIESIVTEIDAEIENLRAALTILSI